MYSNPRNVIVENAPNLFQQKYISLSATPTVMYFLYYISNNLQILKLKNQPTLLYTVQYAISRDNVPLKCFCCSDEFSNP